MTEMRGDSAGVVMPSLLAHEPAASVISACLTAQADAPQRNRLARLFGVSPLTGESRRSYLGALGELRVADELAKLGPAWTVVNAVPVGERGRVIDHLVIGPAGVFAVMVLRLPDAAVSVRGDRLTVNGSPRQHLADCRELATETAVSLTRGAGVNAPVRGLLVVLDARSVSVRNEPDDVATTAVRGLLKRLGSLPAVIVTEQAAAISRAAAEPATWRSAQPLPGSPGHGLDAFDALRVEVQRAWLARGFWGCVVLGAAAIAAAQLFGG